MNALPSFEKTYEIKRRTVEVRVEVYIDEFHCYKAHVTSRTLAGKKKGYATGKQKPPDDLSWRSFELVLNGPGISKLEKKLLQQLYAFY